ncbi:hypothetical protein M2352_005102 [Azospirillum fermentarium]|uniref:hypothetical protein n=1 Tax=Azospirillum fermentarium TaxID=1233114 RepID=UPI002226D4DA|nr:hypothetical protein [Azospirillum fermentarium]MCW2249442.1 hypothetical protein [Azospirillum fermentarium]
MSVELIRLKLRRADGTVALLSGSVVLHPDGIIDFFGDTMAHADTIAALLDRCNAAPRPLEEVPLGAMVRDTAAGLTADRIRIGIVTALSPLCLRPGQPVTVAEGMDPDARALLQRELATFRASRAGGVRTPMAA